MHAFASKPIHVLLLASSLFLFQTFTLAQRDPIFQICSNARNYTNGSQFETNLDLLLSSLTTDVPTDGFYNISTGQDADQVYGLVQCRSDVSPSDCRICLNRSSVEIIDRCPNRKEAVIRFDNCLLRYSDRRFFSQLQNSARTELFNIRNASDPVRFNWQLRNLLDELSTGAASAPSKFAIGNTSYVNSTRIYGLAQCSRDLSDGNCSSCLESLISNVATWLKVGGQVLTASCYIRYEIFKFFQDLPPPPPPVASSPPPIQEEPDGNENGNGTRTVVIVVVAVAIALVLISAVIIYLWRRKPKRRRLDDGNEDEIAGLETILFDLATIIDATSRFSDANKLGQGGFGPVYKGKLTDGQEIAVKRLSGGSVQGIEELRNEVVLVAELQHRNLVRLLGCCLEDHEKMLVYEYLPNKSLDTFLFDPIKRVQLNWETRYKIVRGIARGLLYLHEDSRLRIIHRDLKASNILLDGDMNAKISDFGLARMFGTDQTQVTNRIAGTFGYMAPEYALHGLFSTKSDVYSFGVLVLEIVTGRRNTAFHDSGRITDLTNAVWQHWTKGTVLEMIDQSFDGEYQQSEVLRCIHMGLLCVHNDAAARPPMSSVVLMLERGSMTLPAPSSPAFFVEGSTTTSDVFTTGSDHQASHSDQSTSKLVKHSINGSSITKLNP